MRKASSNDWMRASSRASLRACARCSAFRCLQQIELAPLHRRRRMRAANVLDQLFDLRMLRIDICALINARQECRLPILESLIG